MTIVISDTTPINYLILVGQADLLPTLFGTVIIPDAVLRELQAAGAPPTVREWIANRPSWLEIKRPRARSQLTQLDEGEQEAIQLALELEADLLVIDEKAGREEAIKLNLPVIGTLGIPMSWGCSISRWGCSN